MADVTRQLLELEELLTAAAEIVEKTMDAVAEPDVLLEVESRREGLLGARFFVTEHLLKVSQVPIAAAVPAVHGVIKGIVERVRPREVANARIIIDNSDQVINEMGTLGFLSTLGFSGTHGSPRPINAPPPPPPPPEASGTHGGATPIHPPKTT